MKKTLTTRVSGVAVAAAVVAAVVAAAAPDAGGQGGAIMWQGATPGEKTAVLATAGKELRIPLEAVGPTGGNVNIDVFPQPRGAVLTQTATAPARAVLTWTPSAEQVGDYTLYFTADVGRFSAPELAIYVHVSRKAAGARFRLSSVSGRSHNATLARTVAARAAPGQSGRVVARLRPVTPEAVPHVLYLLDGRIDPGTKRYWLRVQLPVLPNGTTGWIPRDAVEDFRWVDTHLVIDRGRLRATLLKRGRPVFRSIIGVGERRWATPPGRFYIRERLTGFTDPVYGRLAFGTNGRSPVLTDWPGGGFIGIHGTNQPQILPGRVSHGCVRLPNPAISRLDRLMRIGTPVTIR